MVLSKADRERQKFITDKCQSLIEVLLRDEDNKYCVDCDAKGPRWASWNLGVFLCIRCAGIHRNLGVHISKVKSVNLDAWTPEHVAYVQRMGNSKARTIYEANLPEDFRRPQTDTALESFIRSKYEHKKYIKQDYVDPGPPQPAFNVEEELKKMKEQKKSKLSNSTSVKMISSVTESLANSKITSNKSKPSPQAPPASSLVDFDNLDITSVATNETSAVTTTLGNPTTGGAPITKTSTTMDLLTGLDLSSPFDSQSIAPNELSLNNATNSKTRSDILDLDLGFKTQTVDPIEAPKKVVDKDYILSLYSKPAK